MYTGRVGGGVLACNGDVCVHLRMLLTFSQTWCAGSAVYGSVEESRFLVGGGGEMQRNFCYSQPHFISMTADEQWVLTRTETRPHMMR